MGPGFRQDDTECEANRSLGLHIWNAISRCDSREVTARDTLSLAISVVFG